MYTDKNVRYGWQFGRMHDCAGENWDDWQPAEKDVDTEAELAEQQTDNYEPHCDDPDFIVRIIFQCHCNSISHSQ